MALDIQPVAASAPPLDIQPAQAPLDVKPAAPKLDIQPVKDAAPTLDIKPMGKPDAPIDDANRNAIIPYNKKLGWHVPEILKSIEEAAKLPGQVTAGQYNGRPEDLTAPAMNLALGVAFPMGPSTFGEKAGAGVMKSAAEAMATPKPVAMPGAAEIPKPDLPPITPTTVLDTPPPAPETAVQQVKNAAVSLRNIFSPTSAGPGAKLAESSIRDYEGTGLRARTQAENALSQFQAHGEALAQNPEASAQFYNYVQGRSTGAKLADPELQPFADQVRTMAKDAQAKLEELPQTERMGYVTDYFPQMWKNPQQAEAFATTFVGKQGKTGFTQARKYPTIADGLAAGLELAETNPATAMLNYVNNTERYIASAKIFNEGRDAGVIKFANPNSKVPEGWVPLKGRLAGENSQGRMVTTENGDSMFVPAKRAYAPADYAQIYNNYLSTGFEKSAGADLYKAVRGLKNGQTMLQLGLSTHHLATIMMQSMAGDTQRILGALGKGNFAKAGSAAKDLASTPLLALSSKYKAGNKLRQQYEGIKDFGPEMEERAKLFASAGGRVGEDPIYRGSTEKDLLQSYKEGTLGSELQGGLQAAAKNPLGTPVQAIKAAGRIADTVAAPLFKRYIPNMKLAAFDAQLGDWMKANPGAAPEEVKMQAQHIMDLMDERYGEIADSNVFWSRTTKQVLGTLLRAPNWDLGLVRQSFGAGLDAMRAGKQLISTGGVDKKLLDRPTYLMSYALLLAGADAALTYLKTGQPPSNWAHFATYETGGTTPHGNPEQAILPGHPRELMEMLPHPGGGPLSGLYDLGTNKFSSLVTNGYEALQNKDYRGDPLGNYMDRAKHALITPFAPLSLQQMLQGQAAGSNVSLPERMMNIRPAPASVSDPEFMQRVTEGMARKAQRTKNKHDNTQRMRYPDAIGLDDNE